MSQLKMIVRKELLIRLLIVFLSTAVLCACTKERIADPMCRLNAQFKPAPSSAAACIIRMDKQVLAISPQTEVKTWQLPGAKKQIDKSAQCTAHQAVWQSTGLNVEVQQYLGETAEHVQVYNCVLNSGFEGKIQEFPVPPWAAHKIAKIALVNPFETQSHQWSEQSDLILIRTLFNQIH